MQNKRAKLISISSILFIPLLLVVGLKWESPNYGILSTCIILLSMVPFLLLFENRKPKTREIVPIAVMSAIAAVSRFAFAFAPQFKPIIAVIILTAVIFGAEAGFLCGAVSMLVSNFFFGQGPWTPWQMFCCGLIGYVAGLMSQKGLLKNKISITIFGFLSGYVYGCIVDIWTIFGFSQEVTIKSLLAVYAAGFWFNTVLSIATASFLFVLTEPIREKLNRIKVKYGLLEK